MLYLWFKALHIIGFVAWFAGMFYIWRLFVYHAGTTSYDVKVQLAIMERKLYQIIMGPAMVFTVTFGIGLLIIRWEGISHSVWIWMKIGLVGLLIVMHLLAGRYRRQLESGRDYDPRIFRILNEVPTVLLFAIVILAVLKPW